MALVIVLFCLVVTSACVLGYFRMREDLNITMSTNNTMGDEIVRLNKCLDGSEKVNNELCCKLKISEQDLGWQKGRCEELSYQNDFLIEKHVRKRNKKGQFK